MTEIPGNGHLLERRTLRGRDFIMVARKGDWCRTGQRQHHHRIHLLRNMGRQRQWDPALAIRRANSRDPALPNWDRKLYVLLQLISYGEPISSLIAADEGIALSARLRHRVLPHIALSCCLYMAAARKASTVQRLQVLAVCPRLAYESS